jgi:hypothetical protein
MSEYDFAHVQGVGDALPNQTKKLINDSNLQAVTIYIQARVACCKGVPNVAKNTLDHFEGVFIIEARGITRRHLPVLSSNRQLPFQPQL